MLTPAHARVRRKGMELTTLPLKGKELSRAHQVAEAVLDAAEGMQGRRRGELMDALNELSGPARERKLLEGLKKLLLDQIRFEEPDAARATELRRSLFERAAEQRRAGQLFDRETILRRVADERGEPVEALEEQMFADLQSEQRIAAIASFRPPELVERYELQSAQAVLLRATRVVATVRGSSPEAYRQLFRSLKFRRLLHRIERVDEGYRVVIDGPFSIFESVTRYGLALCLALPALRACGRLSLVADVRWGRSRDPLTFRYDWDGGGSGTEPPMPDDTSRLLSALSAGKHGFRATPCDEILDLPGVGTIAPDLVLVNDKRGQRVYLEILGYWSRDAVWKRIEIARSGLPQKIVFAVRERLRVSEAMLDDIDSAALYTYKNTPSAAALMRKVKQVAKCEGL